MDMKELVKNAKVIRKEICKTLGGESAPRVVVTRIGTNPKVRFSGVSGLERDWQQLIDSVAAKHKCSAELGRNHLTAQVESVTFRW